MAASCAISFVLQLPQGKQPSFCKNIPFLMYKYTVNSSENRAKVSKLTFARVQRILGKLRNKQS